MEIIERKVGMFYSWNIQGFGFIMVTPKERYFAHISEVNLDHPPIAGEQVSFLVSPPRKQGKLPCAVDIKPIEVSEVTQ